MDAKQSTYPKMRVPKIWILRKRSRIADRRKMYTILQRRAELPIPLRSIIDEMDHTEKPKAFLMNVEFELYKFLSGINGSLDGERDTVDQVELAIRLFPNVLSRRNFRMSFPVHCLFRSIKSVSFVPLFARLGTELGDFRPRERGGFVLGTFSNCFHKLASSCEDVPINDPTGQELMDRKFLEIIQELRTIDFMKESDIVDYWYMIDTLCQQKHFPTRRFLYLVDWNPRSLLKPNRENAILDALLSRFLLNDDTKSLEGAKMLFGVLMRYYPYDLGFLFDKTTREESTSAFEIACCEFGWNPILSILNNCVNRQIQLDPHFTQKALVRMGSSHADRSEAIYFLIRNSPIIVHQQFRSKPSR